MGQQQRDSDPLLLKEVLIKEMWILKMSGTMWRSQTDPGKERVEEGAGISGRRNMVTGTTRSHRATCGGVHIQTQKRFGVG